MSADTASQTGKESTLRAGQPAALCPGLKRVPWEVQADWDELVTLWPSFIGKGISSRSLSTFPVRLLTRTKSHPHPKSGDWKERPGLSYHDSALGLGTGHPPGFPGT